MLAFTPPGVASVKSAEVIKDTPLERAEDFPNITYWYKRTYLDEKNKRSRLNKRSKRKRPRNKRENVNFWHFQHQDGTVLTCEELKSIRKESKKIWKAICDKYGPIGAPWTTISPARRLEFYVKIENKYPLLRHCDNHYKAESIAFCDYSHWYDKWFPAGNDEIDSPTRVRKRSRSASQVKSQKGGRLVKKARRMVKTEDAVESSSDKSSSNELSSEDESTKTRQSERNTGDSLRDPNANDDSGRAPRCLPFSPVRHNTERAPSNRSSDHTFPSSAPTLSKPKPKARRVLSEADFPSVPLCVSNCTRLLCSLTAISSTNVDRDSPAPSIAQLDDNEKADGTCLPFYWPILITRL